MYKLQSYTIYRDTLKLAKISYYFGQENNNFIFQISTIKSTPDKLVFEHKFHISKRAHFNS